MDISRWIYVSKETVSKDAFKSAMKRINFIFSLKLQMKEVSLLLPFFFDIKK